MKINLHFFSRTLSLPIFFIFILPANSCSPTGPADNNNITLSVEDVSCTEAWINLKTENIFLPFNAILKSDSIVIPLIISSSDTLLYLENLLPNKTYNFNFTIQNQSTSIQYIEASIQLTTLDTTSHSFNWQKFYFGELGTSEINDIVIINERNIWAVGNIWYRDSLNPNDVQFYNGVHWDGHNWELIKIPSQVSYENKQLYIVSQKSVFAINSEDIWFTNEWQMAHWNGKQYGKWEFLKNSGGINKLGGTNETIWAAGKNSNLFKKNINDENWQKINIDKAGDILDVCNVINSNNEKKIYMPLINLDDINENYLMELDNNGKITYVKSVKRLIASVWTKSGFPVYLAGDGIFENKESYWKEIDYGEKKFIERIRGNDLNDILAAGAWGTVAHYNGEDWKTYPELEMDGNYKALSYKDNISAIAGIEGARAVIVIGIRKN